MRSRKTVNTAMDTVPRQKLWTHRAGAAAATKSMGRASIQARNGRSRRAVWVLAFGVISVDAVASGSAGDGWAGAGTVSGTTSDSVDNSELIVTAPLLSVVDPEE